MIKLTYSRYRSLGYVTVRRRSVLPKTDGKAAVRMLYLYAYRAYCPFIRWQKKGCRTISNQRGWLCCPAVVQRWQSPPRHRYARISEPCLDRGRIVINSPTGDGPVPGFNDSILGFTHRLADTPGVEDSHIVSKLGTV